MNSRNMNDSNFKYPKLPEDQYVCLRFQPNATGSDIPDSDIARIVTKNDLPVSVRVVETSYSPRSSLTLHKGALLTLHFIRRTERVYVTDTKGNDFYLPLCARQLYQILPMNPLNDERQYEGTAALIKGNPLPERVRIVEAHFSDHPGEAQEIDDIIEIDGIEERPVPIDSDNPPQKCIIGRCNGIPIAFSESMDCATYSTMPSEDFLSLSETVAKFPLPLRVRKADHRDSVMILHRKDSESHVIATTANTKHILSIPITWQGKVEMLENENLDKLFRSLLPPLYPLVNTSWGLKEPGRCDLQPNMKEVAQPLIEILEDWSRTKEGQEFVLKESGNSKQLVERHKLTIEELIEEIDGLDSRLKAYDTNNTPAPPLSPRGSPPSRPPKPDSRFPHPPVSPSSPTAQDNDDDDYEKVPSSVDFPSSIMSAGKVGDLKKKLQLKDKEIRTLNESLQSVKTNNENLNAKNLLLLEQIVKLQNALQMQAPANASAYSAYSARRDITSYTVEEVVHLLREIQLEKYVDVFKQSFIDGMLLTNLTEDELHTEIGMGRIPAKRLLMEVRKRQNVS